MLEQLTNLRNNKLPQPNDTVQQLKKFLSSTKTGGVAPAPLAVSLADIMSADKKGRWWLVGAAWAGDPLVDAQNDDNRPALQTRKVEDDKLAKIARRMGMNTDVRKDIFRVLMTSEVRSSQTVEKDKADATGRTTSMRATAWHSLA